MLNILIIKTLNVILISKRIIKQIIQTSIKMVPNNHNHPIMNQVHEI